MRGGDCRVTEVLTTEEWETITELSALACNSIMLRFNKFVDADDLRQECYLAAAEKQTKIAGWLRREGKSDVKQGERSTLKYLQKRAEKYARQQKANKLGYEVDDEYFYQSGLIEGLLSVLATGDYELAGQILDPADAGGRRKKSLPSEGNNIIALVSDVDRAFKRLSERDKQILMLKHASGLSSQEIADQMGVTRQRIDQLLHRGVRKMVEELGGSNPRH
jgi:RNA polymerase sigma factor (sigma-70 family)